MAHAHSFSALRVRLLFGLAALVALVGVLAGAWQLSKSRTVQAFGRLVARVETSRPVVALTFDDGPRGHAPVLDVLGRHGVPATFFVCGSGMEQPAEMALARRMVAEGHELGNHSYSHRRMVLKTPGWVAREVEATDRLIRQAGHAGPITFRPPYGKKLLVLPFYLAQTGRTTVMWDVEGELAATPEGILAVVKRETRPGSIILLHGARQATQAAVEPIVKWLASEKYRLVTVSELLSAR